MIELSSYNTSDYLKDEEDVIGYFKEAQKLANELNSPELVLDAIGQIARSEGMAKLATKTQLNRESLYKSLSKKGNPSFVNIFKIIRSLGFKLEITEEQPSNSPSLELAPSGA